MIINEEYFKYNLKFTDRQIDRIMLMYKIACNISNNERNGLILKGGTSLLFCHKLNRFSMDLDYDGKILNVNIEKEIKEALLSNNKSLFAINVKKNTNTVKRYMIHYKEEPDNPIKVEISFRNIDLLNDSNKNIEYINGINTYNINYIAENKINTFLTRMAARDIYDTAFLLDNYSELIGKDLILKCKNKIDSVGLDTLENIMNNDEIIKIYKNDEILLKFDQKINDLLKDTGKSGENNSSISNTKNEILKNNDINGIIVGKERKDYGISNDNNIIIEKKDISKINKCINKNNKYENNKVELHYINTKKEIKCYIVDTNALGSKTFYPLGGEPKYLNELVGILKGIKDYKNNIKNNDDYNNINKNNVKRNR